MKLQKRVERLENQTSRDGTTEPPSFEATMAAYQFVKSGNESFLTVTNPRCVEAVRKAMVCGLKENVPG